METIRRVGLRGTELARARVGTIRLRLLKIGTVIVRSTRRIRFFFSSAYPHQELFAGVCVALSCICDYKGRRLKDALSIAQLLQSSIRRPQSQS